MQLFREIGLLSSTFLVIGNIIGIGIFTTSGLIAAELGNSIWLLAVWIIGGLLALIGATCYSLLVVQTPKAGGEYALLYPSYGPLSAFLAGWASLFIGFSAPIAASALGLAHYLLVVFPSDSLPNVAPKLVAGVSLILVIFLLSVGLQMGNRLHSFVTSVNLLLTLGFAVIVLGQVPATENLRTVFTGSDPFDWPSLGSSVVMVMFAYSGWNAAAYVAEEVRNPERFIPGALLLGTGIVIAAYLLMNLAYFGSVPFEELVGEIPVAEIAAQAAFGSSGRLLVNTLIIFSILSSLTAMSIAGPRVYFAMSRNRLFPRWLSEVDVNKKLPLKAIWFQTFVALVLITIGTFRQILLYSGFVMLLFTTLTVSTLLLQSAQGTAQRAHHGTRIFLYRILPVIFVGTNLVMLLNAAVSNPWETAAGLGTISAGLPVYFYYRRKGRIEAAERLSAPALPQSSGRSERR